VPDVPDTRRIHLDTLGRLRAHRHGLFGYCLACDERHRNPVPGEQRIGGIFAIDLDALIAERGADASCIRMAPIPCPRCGSRQTEYRIIAPARASDPPPAAIPPPPRPPRTDRGRA
jgi:hypothetical protein